MSDPTIRDGDAPASPAAPAPAASFEAAPRPPGEARAADEGGPSVKARAGGVLPIVAISVIVVVLVGVGAFTAYWFFAIATLEERVAGWIEQREAEGWRIDHREAVRSGFPTMLRLTLADGSIAAPAGWSWASPSTEISLPVFAGWEGRAAPVDVAFAGDQRIRLSPAETGPTIVAHGDRLVARVTAAGWLPTGTFAADNLVVAAADGGPPLVFGRIDATSTGNPAEAAAADHASFDLSVVAQALTLPRSLALALGDRVERLDIEARLMGSLAPPPWPEAIAHWRDAGGTIEVTRLGLAYGPLELSGDGTLALDEAGDVIGAFSITAQGLAPALAALADRGAIPADIAAAARFVLGPPAAGNAPGPGTAKSGGASVTVPVSIQNRVVFLGPLPIARLPAPPWSLRGR